MPTLNPRITVTLAPEVHAVMKRLAKLAGNSQSAIIGDLLHSALPVFDRMVQALEAAEVLKQEGMKAPQAIKDSLDRAQTKMEAQLDIFMGELDGGMRPLLKEAEKVNRRASSGRTQRRRVRPEEAVAVLSTPVPVTRGSGHPKGPAKGGATRKANSPKTDAKKAGKGVRNGKV